MPNPRKLSDASIPLRRSDARRAHAHEPTRHSTRRRGQRLPKEGSHNGAHRPAGNAPGGSDASKSQHAPDEATHVTTWAMHPHMTHGDERCLAQPRTEPSDASCSQRAMSLTSDAGTASRPRAAAKQQQHAIGPLARKQRRRRGGDGRTLSSLPPADSGGEAAAAAAQQQQHAMRPPAREQRRRRGGDGRTLHDTRRPTAAARWRLQQHSSSSTR